MNLSIWRLGALALALLASCASAQAAAYIYSYSSACGGGSSPQCTDDVHFGDPARSSASRADSFVPASGDGGYNYSAETSGAAVATGFALFAHAGGSTYGLNGSGGTATFGMSATTLIEYHDEVTVAGSGFGTLLIPWHVTGAFDIGAISAGHYVPNASFGVPFCQSIVTGNNSGGSGCAGGGSTSFTSPSAYDSTFMLAYAIQFGVTYSLNTRFVLSVGSGAGLVSAAAADFTHTGLQQPASVYDSQGALIPDALISAASGMDYRNPQANSVPIPASLALFGSAVVGLGWTGRRRVHNASRQTSGLVHPLCLEPAS